MTMVQVAEVVGGHERRGQSCFQQIYDTPQGIFELKYFLTSGSRLTAKRRLEHQRQRNRGRHVQDENPASRFHQKSSRSQGQSIVIAPHVRQIS